MSFGSDIKLDNELQPLILNNGEVVLTDEVETVLQDIFLRLITLKGSLFYDADFGSELPLFIKDDEVNNADIIAEIVKVVEDDPRVEPYSVSATVHNELSKLTVTIDLKLSNNETPYNITIPNMYNIFQFSEGAL